MTSADDAVSRRRWVGYLVVTLYVAVTSLAAGALDVAHAAPLYPELLRLGYPPHFGTVLGVWKALGATALLTPRRPLLKEWAYAGLFFDLTSAVVAHAAAGDAPGSFVGPAIGLVALVASWSLRPPSRRLAGTFAHT